MVVQKKYMILSIIHQTKMTRQISSKLSNLTGGGNVSNLLCIIMAPRLAE